MCWLFFYLFSTKVVCCLVNAFWGPLCAMCFPWLLPWFSSIYCFLLVPVSGGFSGTWVVQKHSVCNVFMVFFLKMCVSPTVHQRCPLGIITTTTTTASLVSQIRLYSSRARSLRRSLKTDSPKSPPKQTKKQQSPNFLSPLGRLMYILYMLIWLW